MDWKQFGILVAILVLLCWLSFRFVRSLRRAVRLESSFANTSKGWSELRPAWKLLFSLEIACVAALFGFFGWKYSEQLQAPPQFFPALSAIVWVLITGFLFAPVRLKGYLASKTVGSMRNWAQTVGIMILGLAALALATGVIGAILALVDVISGRN